MKMSGKVGEIIDQVKSESFDEWKYEHQRSAEKAWSRTFTRGAYIGINLFVYELKRRLKSQGII